MHKDFILEIPNNLSEKFCNIVIDQFEKDDRKKDGVVGMFRRIDKNVKTSIDLCLNEVKNDTPFWNDVDKVLSKKLSDAIIQYKNYISEKFDDYTAENWGIFLNDMHDTGYQIQRTDPGGFYVWHNDFMVENSRSRYLTFIWYLNTLEKDQEGNTEIIDDIKIRPETGKLLIFPATWTTVHRGGVLKYGKKYLITGWLYNN